MDLTFDQFTILPLDTNDPKSFYQLVNNNLDRLVDYFPITAGNANSLEQMENYCSKIKEEIKRKIYLPYIIQDGEEWIGLLDLKRINWDFPKAEIGYFIDQKYAGKGIMTKALDCWIVHVVQKFSFKKLIARIDTVNKSSSKVVLSNGFQLEGTIRLDHLTLDGKLIDVLYYGRLFV
jgi:RimJ/RimL family protein N-acetyltransferase